MFSLNNVSISNWAVGGQFNFFECGTKYFEILLAGLGYKGLGTTGVDHGNIPGKIIALPSVVEKTPSLKKHLLKSKWFARVTCQQCQMSMFQSCLYALFWFFQNKNTVKVSSYQKIFVFETLKKRSCIRTRIAGFFGSPDWARLIWHFK